MIIWDLKRALSVPCNDKFDLLLEVVCSTLIKYCIELTPHLTQLSVGFVDSVEFFLWLTDKE